MLDRQIWPMEASRVRASAHMNMHSDRSSVKVIKVIIWACWENT